MGLVILIWDTSSGCGFFSTTRNTPHWWMNRRAYLFTRIGHKDIEQYKLYYFPAPYNGLVAYRNNLNNYLRANGSLLTCKIAQEIPAMQSSYSVWLLQLLNQSVPTYRIIAGRRTTTAHGVKVTTARALNRVKNGGVLTGISVKPLGNLSKQAIDITKNSTVDYTADDLECSLLKVVPDMWSARTLRNTTLKELKRKYPNVIFF
jgi:hypothetical protein